MTDFRPIKPLSKLALRSVEISAITSELPRLEWVKPADLYVEEDYQRDLSERSITLIRRIVERWSWSKIKPCICVRVGDKLTVIDGQHTAIAAASRGDIAKVPVMIVDAKTMKERAEAFVSQNRDRLALTAGHMHYAARAAGEEIAVAVTMACEKAGARILKTSPGAKGEYRVGDTFAVGIISKIVAKIGAHQGGKVLKVLVDAKRAPLAAHEIAAVYQLLFEPEFKGKVDTFDLVTAIRSKSVHEWRAAAWKMSEEGASQRQMVANAIFRSMKRRPAHA